MKRGARLAARFSLSFGIAQRGLLFHSSIFKDISGLAAARTLARCAARRLACYHWPLPLFSRRGFASNMFLATSIDVSLCHLSIRRAGLSAGGDVWGIWAVMFLLRIRPGG